MTSVSFCCNSNLRNFNTTVSLGKFQLGTAWTFGGTVAPHHHPFTKFLGVISHIIMTGFELIGAKVPFFKRFGWQCRDLHKKDILEWSGKGLEGHFKNEALGPGWRKERPLAKVVL